MRRTDATSARGAGRREPDLASQAGQIKPRPLGHQGTMPGPNMRYAPMKQVIQQCDLDALSVTGAPPRPFAYRGRIPGPTSGR